MIEYLDNRIFLILAVIVYLIIIIHVAKLLNVFKIIASLKVTKDFTSKITANKFFERLSGIVVDKIKPVFVYSVKNIISPGFTYSGKMLHKISEIVININHLTDKYLSENSKEVFELTGVFTRKIVYAESGSIWTSFLAFLVLFYFILTNL